VLKERGEEWGSNKNDQLCNANTGRCLLKAMQ